METKRGINLLFLALDTTIVLEKDIFSLIMVKMASETVKYFLSIQLTSTMTKLIKGRICN